MARIHTVTKSRASKRGERTCEVCREVIPVGAPYKWAKPNRYTSKRTRCATCPTWRQSELTTSKMAALYAGQESAGDALDAVDPQSYVDDTGETDAEGTEWPTFDPDAFVSDVQSALTEAADAARETASDYQDGIDNLPDGLRDSSPVAEEGQEKIDALESYADELESFSPSASFDPPERDTEQPDFDPDQWRQDFEDAVATFGEEVVEEARDLVDNFDY